MKRTLLAMLATGLIMALMGAGTMAYFSASATSTANSFQTGTLTLNLANDGSTWQSGVTATWAPPTNWAPGDTHTATLYLKNTGSVGSKAVYENWKNASGYTALLDHIFVTEISDSYAWSGGSNKPYGDNYLPNFLNSDVNTNHDGFLTLAELGSWGDRKVTSSSPKPWDVKETTDPNDTGVVLPAGGTLGLRYTFQFDPAAGNEFQGKTMSIDLNVMASQNVLPGL